jgi:hypothetical protein
MTRRKKNTWRRLIEPARRATASFARCAARLGPRCWTAVLRRLGRQGPTIIVDARRRQAGKLRAAVRRAALTYASGVGVELTRDLLVIIQRVVHEGRQLNALLQAFDGPAESRRYVIYLALSVNGRQVGEDELVSAFRHQLAQVLGDVVGQPVLSVSLDLEVPRLRASAPIVELRPEDHAPQNGRERGAIPIERIEHKAS